MNTMVYEVEFEDGDIVEYSANSIAENMLQQIDSEDHVGRHSGLQEG
jgi:leucyl aminopeptidase (aminopeptidase T)